MTRRYEGEEVIIPEDPHNMPLPLLGTTTVTYLGKTYRCVAVFYADKGQTGGAPELRVWFREEASPRVSN